MSPFSLQIYSTETRWRWPLSFITALFFVCFLALISAHFYPWNPTVSVAHEITPSDFLIIQQPPEIEVQKQPPVEVIETPVDTKIFQSIWSGTIDISEDFSAKPEKPMAKAKIHEKKWEGIREREKSIFNEFWLK